MACSEEREDGRENWSHKCDYILTMAGFAIGLSNVWRFPYLCYVNGGGAFLVPYLLMLLLVGLPLFFLETAVGQFSSSSCMRVFSVCPAFKGVGLASVAVNLFTLTYYIVLVSYPVLFLTYSFTWELPWATCGHDWNSENCTVEGTVNGTNISDGVSAADEFFHNKLLKISSGIDDIGTMQWPIVLVTFFTTALVFFCIFKGVKVLGKVVWFTATFPFVMLFILLIRGLTLPGAMDGVYFYIYPEFDKLTEMKVWAAAAIQIFYSLGPGWGTLISLGSLNKFHNQCTRDVVIVPIMNCATSIFAGFVVFSVLGFMAHRAGVSVEEVAVAGPSLAFIVYPEALSLMPFAPLWSVLFFLMMFFLGIDSCFAHVETPVLSFLDEFPSLRHRRGLIAFIYCFIVFALTLIFGTNGGMYWITLVDWYCASFTVIIVCMCQIFIFSFIYGAGRTVNDIQMMTEERVAFTWWVFWLIVTPVIMLIIFVNTMVSHSGAGYRGVMFPSWAQGIGWSTALASILMIPIYFIYSLCRAKGSLKQRFISCLSPAASWGPALEAHREEWRQYKIKHPLRHPLLHPNLCERHSRTPASEDLLMSRF